VTAPTAYGLTAAELGLVAGELSAFCGAELLDAALLAGGDDVLLVLSTGEQKQFVHVALGSRRARVCTTARRFGKDARAPGPRADFLQHRLAGRTLAAIDLAPGERRLAFVFDGGLRLEVELFSARGLWALLDGSGTVLAMSRDVATAVRTLRPGTRYAPPPQAKVQAAEPAPRFSPPVLDAIDAHFTAQDRIAEAQAELERLRLAAARAAQKLQQKCNGLRAQLAEGARVDEVRAEADLMLAYAHAVPRGAASMTVPDPFTGEPRRIELDPSRPVTVQAQTRYDRARRLQEGLQIGRERLATAEGALALLQPVQARLADPAPLDDGGLAALRAELEQLGALPRNRPATAAQKPDRRAQGRRVQGENLRRFVSAEGYDVLVGRDNEQNDRLTLRIANGNDLWLHVGGGRPGSHVVVRLPKGKTASLETLLDAGALAVHFSKARGERVVDVVYTQAKHVRKPKGLPAGAVVPGHTKTITVRADEARLRRLLDSAGDQGTDH
jgi:predicted ribosome quality control (RQC) complex YloA/Tae2 family protein